MKHSRLSHIPLLVAVILFNSGRLLGQEEALLPQDIAREVEETSRSGGDWLLPVLEDWNRARQRIEKDVGLSWSARYDTVTLGDLLGDGMPVGSSGDLTVQGIWVLGSHWVDDPNELRFRFRERHAHGGRAASELGPEAGALWGMVDGFSNSGFEVPDFFFRHNFTRAGIELRYGQMAIDSQFGGHQLASAKRNFLNQSFASNPAVAFPRFGAGVTFMKTFDNGFSVGFGSTTVQGTQTGTQVDLKLGSGDLFQALQFAYDMKGADGLARRIQVLGWHSDAVGEANQPEGEGLSITYEQELDANGTLFFSRFSWADGGATPLEQFLGAGFGRPCGEDDFLGFAAGIGRSSGPGKEIQAVLEGFYRWQLRKNLQITPDVQLLLGEGFDDGPGVRVVAGLRASVSF